MSDDDDDDDDISESLIRDLLDDLTPKSVSDTALLRLHHVFGPMLVHALTLADKGDVVRIALPGDNRHIYQVTSTTSGTYTVYPSDRRGSRGYCPCQAFEYSCLAGKEAIYCKHLLAVALSQRLDLENKSRVTREQVSKLFRTQTS